MKLKIAYIKPTILTLILTSAATALANPEKPSLPEITLQSFVHYHYSIGEDFLHPNAKKTAMLYLVKNQRNGIEQTFFKLDIHETLGNTKTSKTGWIAVTDNTGQRTTTTEINNLEYYPAYDLVYFSYTDSEENKKSLWFDATTAELLYN